MKWWDQMPWSLFSKGWILSQLFHSSCTFIKNLFHSSSLSAIRMVASAYLRLLIFLPAILIPACESSSPAFCMMYSAYKLNKQGDNIQPWCTPFPIFNQTVVPRPVLTVVSCPAYRFLRRQVRNVLHASNPAAVYPVGSFLDTFKSFLSFDILLTKYSSFCS